MGPPPALPKADLTTLTAAPTQSRLSLTGLGFLARSEVVEAAKTLSLSGQVDVTLTFTITSAAKWQWWRRWLQWGKARALKDLPPFSNRWTSHHDLSSVSLYGSGDFAGLAQCK